MAQKVQNVYVGQGSCPLPDPTRVPTLPPSTKFFLGFFVFLRTSFLISRLLASTYVTVAQHFKHPVMATSKTFPTVYRIWGCRNRFVVINPQIDPLWVIFADVDNLAPPGELVCVCSAAVLPPDDSTNQERQFLFPVNFS